MAEGFLTFGCDLNAFCHGKPHRGYPRYFEVKRVLIYLIQYTQPRLAPIYRCSF